jgi:serine/threonine protein kinase/alpha-beta hydrolase superfamily lysophospholipase
MQPLAVAIIPGIRLGPYEIAAQIGKGGMGEVYRAFDTNLGRQVAIKILPDTFADDPERLARFEREAKTLATLNHPNIAQIYGLERSGRAPALVLELVEGPTLAERVTARPMAVHEVLTIASQIAEAIEAAHRKGIVHRDLKPTNIKLASDGRVKVLDFGLAKTFDQGSMTDLSEAATFTAGSTQAGVVLGTLAYMSPEQARGKAVDNRTDIWAFGCVLYEMLTGRKPFGGETASDVIVSVLERDPIWEALPQKTPRRVRQLLGRCLEKNNRHRLRDIGDARLELKEALEREESTSSSQRIAQISVESMPTQDIRYCRIADGIALAYSTIGKGYPLVMVPHWMSHLEADFRNPLTRHYWVEFSKRYKLVRYDTRGYGLSDRVVPEFRFDAFVTDLETVIDVLHLDQFALLGPSGGASVGVAYAARHPERVSHLILLGGFIRGPRRIGDPAGVAFAEMIEALVRVGWGQSSSRFRNVFCAMLVPDGTPEQYKWMDDAQLAASSGEHAERYFKILSDVDLSEEAARITTPTLVFHGTGDTAVPFSEAQYTAARIPNARLVPLPTKNHHLLADEPAWTQFLQAMDEFVSGNTSGDRP